MTLMKFFAYCVKEYILFFVDQLQNNWRLVMCYIPNVIPPAEWKNAVEFANTYIQTFHKH